MKGEKKKEINGKLQILRVKRKSYKIHSTMTKKEKLIKINM